jgi:hypothetical protein
MALNWSIDKIRGYKRRCWIKTGKVDSDGKPLCNLHPVTEMLIWQCGLTVGIPYISDENWGDVLARLRHLEEERGKELLYRFDKKKEQWIPRKVTERDVRNHIGLGTNGSRFTWKELKKRTKKEMGERKRSREAYEKRQAEKEAS